MILASSIVVFDGSCYLLDGTAQERVQKNYLKRRRKMLKERKAQDEDPTSHLPEEESNSSPAESVVDEPNPKKRGGNDSHTTFCANAQYRTLGELPPEFQFNPMKDNLHFSFAKIL